VITLANVGIELYEFSLSM